MKKISTYLLLCIMLLCSCSSTPDPLEDYSKEDAYYLGYEEGSHEGYNERFDDGREDGYDIGWESYICEDCNSFQGIIYDLMYDHEYEAARKLLEYDRDNIVKLALENEFGTSDIDSIINYFYELSITEAGICDICGKKAYADDEFYSRDGLIYIHDECRPETSNSAPIKIGE